MRHPFLPYFLAVLVLGLIAGFAMNIYFDAEADSIIEKTLGKFSTWAKDGDEKAYIDCVLPLDDFPGRDCDIDESKRRLLGVREKSLRNYGAVSDCVAEEMAQGARKRARTDWGLAVTGIAGPSGGTPEKPVGLVFIGTAIGDLKLVTESVFPGNRTTVRQRTVSTALNQLRLQLLEN